MTERIGISEVVEVIGKSEFTIRQYMKKRNFPKPIYIKELLSSGIEVKVRYWDKQEILDWKKANRHWL